MRINKPTKQTIIAEVNNYLMSLDDGEDVDLNFRLEDGAEKTKLILSCVKQSKSAVLNKTVELKNGIIEVKGGGSTQ